jgi:hypothetical protein
LPNTSPPSEFACRKLAGYRTFNPGLQRLDSSFESDEGRGYGKCCARNFEEKGYQRGPGDGSRSMPSLIVIAGGGSRVLHHMFSLKTGSCMHQNPETQLRNLGTPSRKGRSSRRQYAPVGRPAAPQFAPPATFSNGRHQPEPPPPSCSRIQGCPTDCRPTCVTPYLHRSFSRP